MPKMRALIAMLALTALASCASSTETPAPVAPGPAVHELKSSPCACNEIPMDLPQGFQIEALS